MDIFIHLLYFVQPGLDLVPLFVGMRERSDYNEPFLNNYSQNLSFSKFASFLVCKKLLI